RGLAHVNHLHVRADVPFGELLDVGAGREELRVGALHDDHARGAIYGLVDRVRVLAHELEVVRVGRRLVERDEPERSFVRERDSHGYASPPTTTDLISTYESSASIPCSLPYPEALTPPKGSSS